MPFPRLLLRVLSNEKAQAVKLQAFLEGDSNLFSWAFEHAQYSRM